MIIHICDIYPTCFFFLNRKPSVSAACIGKTATTGKVATQTTADTNQKSENTSKALIVKAEQTNKAIKSGKHLSKAVVTRKSPAESSSRDGKSEQTPGTCSKVSVVVGKDTGVVDRSKDGTAVEAKPVLEAKVSKIASVPQTPSDPSVALNGAGSALRVSSASTASDNQPPRKELKTTHGGGSADIKGRNITPEVAASGKTDDKHTASQPAASLAAPSTKKGTINAEGIDTLIIKAEMLLQVLQFDHCYYIFI